MHGAYRKCYHEWHQSGFYIFIGISLLTLCTGDRNLELSVMLYDPHITTSVVKQSVSYIQSFVTIQAYKPIFYARKQKFIAIYVTVFAGDQIPGFG